MKLAKYTAQVTNVSTPCWVCSFRPHHSGDAPTSVPIPIAADKMVCLLWAARKAVTQCGDFRCVFTKINDSISTIGLGFNSKWVETVPTNWTTCIEWSRYTSPDRWIFPKNFSRMSNRTIHKGMTLHRNPVPAPVGLYRDCREGDVPVGTQKATQLLVTYRRYTNATPLVRDDPSIYPYGRDGSLTVRKRCGKADGTTYACESSGWLTLNVTRLKVSEGTKVGNVTTARLAVPDRRGFPTPKGHVWLCGDHTYFTLPENWCGTCTLAVTRPSSIVLPEELMQETVGRYGHHNPHEHHQKRRLTVGDRPVGKVYVPFSDNDGRQPLFGDAKGFFGTIIPRLGTASSMKSLNEVWWVLEDITDILGEILDQLAASPELKAVATVAMQNRVALDALHAENGGMCAAVGIDHCCTYIPDETGNWTLIRHKVADLRKFLRSQEDQNPQWTWMNWLNSGSWTHILQKIALIIGVILLLGCVLLCCVVPLFRSMINRALAPASGIFPVRSPSYDVEMDVKSRASAHLLEGGDPDLLPPELRARLLAVGWSGPQEGCDGRCGDHYS
ncbi:uncharacterized protein LOC127612838 [Hippocampus zosterae]|uniref:uncharacterized protein LOC127612838 n=1 Tax=Hippocampus zosterae TaxID=109293 RepID=UPI00223DA15B|nr:uncharacterized protein LOC127612838 [Hippocampus zosterae]